MLGAKTGEQNLLQLFPEFEKQGGRVTTLRVATEEETLVKPATFSDLGRIEADKLRTT